MTMATAAPRQNAEGSPCPPWCATDHGAVIEGYGPLRSHGSGWNPVRLRDGSIAGASAAWHSDPSVPQEVQVHGAGRGLWLDPDAAEKLAVLVGHLATATPGQHRALAEAIRQAAALITGKDGTDE